MNDIIELILDGPFAGPTLTVLRGLPGSGKSTYAAQRLEEWERIVSRDTLRAAMFGATVGLSHTEEEAVTVAEEAAVRAGLKQDRDVIVDAMHLRPRYLRRWKRIAEEFNAHMEVMESPTGLEECIRRDAQRENPVGEEVIRGLARKYMPKGSFLPMVEPDGPGALEPYVPPKSGARAIIVDIDGTLALMGDRNPYDLSRVGEDGVNYPVQQVVWWACGLWNVILCSGREESAREATEAWLDACGIPYDALLMRPTGDRRQDAVVKAELFDQHIRHQYDVQFVLDDRDQVVKMWRSLGLTCFQVAEGDF